MGDAVPEKLVHRVLHGPRALPTTPAERPELALWTGWPTPAHQP
jgi:hypothetical protein